MHLEYAVSHTATNGETNTDFFEEHGEALLRKADLEAEDANDIEFQERPVGEWRQAHQQTITVSRDRANAALMAQRRSEQARDFINGAAIGERQTETTATFTVDKKARIVRLLYPELTQPEPEPATPAAAEPPQPGPAAEQGAATPAAKRRATPARRKLTEP